MYGGVLSLFVKFSMTKNIKFVKKKQENMEDLKNCAKKNVENWKKKPSDKNDSKMDVSGDLPRAADR